jgi:uncharacterized protein YdaU (DUF1376 family)
MEIQLRRLEALSIVGSYFLILVAPWATDQAAAVQAAATAATAADGLVVELKDTS